MREFEVPEGAKPCPFCGRKNQKVFVYDTFAKIACECGLILQLSKQEQEYVHVEGDMYRLTGESNSDFLKRIGKTWNKRWHA